MATEQYSIGYEEGFQNGWNAAVDAKPEQPAQQEQNRQIDQLIQERDHRDEIIDKLCDAVLGPDRYEWSSQYFFEDAVREVEERMAEQPAQQQQEPVYVYTCKGCESLYRENDVSCDCTVDGLMEFNRHILLDDTFPPAQRTWVGLTDKEIADIATSHPLTWVNLNTVEHRRYFARAIESKLKEKNT